jgi:hypothetical protein
MLRPAARRLAAVTALAAVLVAALVGISAAGAAAQRPHVVYRNFCPTSPAQVAAAGPYVTRR